MLKTVKISYMLVRYLQALFRSHNAIFFFQFLLYLVVPMYYTCFMFWSIIVPIALYCTLYVVRSSLSRYKFVNTNFLFIYKTVILYIRKIILKNGLFIVFVRNFNNIWYFGSVSKLACQLCKYLGLCQLLKWYTLY